VQNIVIHTPTNNLKNIKLEEDWAKINPDVSHFYVFGSISWAHIPDEKRKALQPKSEKCIFVGYSDDVKGYRLLQPHCNENIIRIDVKFDENILACEPDLMIVPTTACEPCSTFVPSFVPIMVSSLDDDNEDESPTLPTHLPLDDSFEPKPAPTPPLPRWVHSTREAIRDIVGDPSYHHQTHSQLQ
jgi:hypothetical protein